MGKRRTIVFIHGAWMTPLCWGRFVRFFEERGHICIAPGWPYRDRPLDELRRAPSPRLAGLGVGDIVAHYERLIADLDEPPIMIGHSFGGLFVQMLVDRGLGMAGVAIDPAPPRGVRSLYWSSLQSNKGVLLTWCGWRRIVRLSFPDFRYAFVHTLGYREQRAAYDEHVVPETGRIFFQAALASIDLHPTLRVDFANGTRPPLLLIAGEDDHIVPAAMVRETYHKYRNGPAYIELMEFARRTHWIIAQDGWDEVAGYIAEWLERWQL